MSERVLIDQASVPRLPRHVKLRFDERRDKWVMLAPERVLMPDAIAVEVLQRCDGVATVATIVADLAARYNAPRDVIARDVTQLLQDLSDKGLLEA